LETKLFTHDLDAQVPAEVEEEPFLPELEGLDEGALREAMEALSLDHREVLTLRYLQGFEYEEIAEIVDRKVGTVRSRLHYAKRALREKLLSSLPMKTYTEESDG
jgi:RNA polymerase sigma-70 factor (ECF subfamily)